MTLPKSLSAAVGLLVPLLGLFANQAAAQVSTDCQPLNRTGCPANPALGVDHTWHFNKTPSEDLWETQVGKIDYDAENGASLTINKQGDSPTLRSKFYFFFGRVEVHMKTAPGTGIISSVMLLSDDLDEIDWEFFGGNNTHAENNYFGKGVTNYLNAEYHQMDKGPQDEFHNYTINWTKDTLDFYIDTEKRRTLHAADANNTLYYPQTPMRISFGIWAGGDPRLAEGTRQWAGGNTDFDKGPFTMNVKSTRITDFSSGKEYSYGDKTGSWESIRIVEGSSAANETINEPPELSLAEKWDALSTGAKTGIYVGAVSFVALAALAGLFYFIRQRRQGAREARAAFHKAEEERLEMERFRKEGGNPDALGAAAGAEYDARSMRKAGLASSDAYSVPPSPTQENMAPVGTWDATSGSAAGGFAAAPLLRNGEQSPPLASATPYSDGPSGAPPSFPAPEPGRVGSPGPQGHSGGEYWR